MCHDCNSASLSVRYINAQLTALWENAVECINSTKNNASDVRSTQYEKSKYTRALAQYHYFGKRAPKAQSLTVDDFHFYATFGKPSLKFICNHDAVISFTIEKGHANLDYKPVTGSNRGGVRAES